MRFSSEQNKKLIEDDSRQRCLVHQMNHMSVFYVAFSVIDILLLVAGDLLNKKNPIFACSQNIYMLPRNNAGATYLFIDGLIFFLFSYNILHIFFKIPDHYGLIVKQIANQGSIENLLIEKETFLKKPTFDPE